MGKIAIVTDSNSGITPALAKEWGVFVVPMPFFINEKVYYEDLTLTQPEFYRCMEQNAEISTSMPAIGEISDLWEKLLQDYDQVLHIPMSSGLSGSCGAAMALAQDFDGKVQVVDNKRISVTQKLSVREARDMVAMGWSAEKIKKYLEDTQYDSSIYITLNTLYYLKKGGRITPAAAALGTLLRLKPVLQIQGDKLDAYAKSRTLKAAKATMLEAIQKDMRERFHAKENAEDMEISVVYSGTDMTEVEIWKNEVQEVFPNHTLMMDPLSLSVACHIGPGALAITCSKKFQG
ncbi:MAG TPA: DegV family protein [Candidatus Choladousia intestinigallinarum]|nr:DegV family protein [Candidatus Choladousia intestinigallinarum]